MIFDTHAHYDDEAFDGDREELLRSLPEHGVEAVTNAGATFASCKMTLQLVNAYPHVFGAVGIHPEHAEELDDEVFDWLKAHTGHKKIVAVGEIGLDYYWDEPDREIQKAALVRQLALAKEVKLPVIIHSRDAAKDTLDILKADYHDGQGGVIHCFSYGKEMAREFLNLGFYLGLGGVVTFKNAARVKEVAAYVPADRLVLETDCPYMAPVPNRGKRNSSLYLPYVAEEISGIRGIPAEELIEKTCQNAKRLYQLA